MVGKKSQKIAGTIHHTMRMGPIILIKQFLNNNAHTHHKTVIDRRKTWRFGHTSNGTREIKSLPIFFGCLGQCG